MREFCRGQIAHYKIPRYVKFVDAFPMTVTGKVQKFKMREAAIEELGLRRGRRDRHRLSRAARPRTRGPEVSAAALGARRS